MKLLLIAVVVALSGCADKEVRVVELDSEIPILDAARVGGCFVTTSDDQVAGRVVVVYKGIKCTVTYTTNNEKQ